MELYFGDANFRRDVFMKRKAAENELGFISIETLLTFNRLRALETSVEEVAGSVEASDSVVLSDDRLSIRRKEPLGDAKDVPARTVFVKGFGADNKEITIEFVRERFQRFGAIDYVDLLRTPPPDRNVRGSVLIEFSATEGAQAMLAAKDELEYNGEQLVVRPGSECPVKEKRKRGEKRSRDTPSGPQIDDGVFLKVSVPAGASSWREVKLALAEFGKVAHVMEASEFAQLAASTSAGESVEETKEDSKDGESKEAAKEEPDAAMVKGEESAPEAAADGAEEPVAKGEGGETAPAEAMEQDTQVFVARMYERAAADRALEKAASEEGVVMGETKLTVSRLEGDEEKVAKDAARKALVDGINKPAPKRRSWGGRGRKNSRG
ncbi:MAG: hypothetical protein AAF368_16765, partial [Planctomycetota bacterium]